MTSMCKAIGAAADKRLAIKLFKQLILPTLEYAAPTLQIKDHRSERWRNKIYLIDTSTDLFRLAKTLKNIEHNMTPAPIVHRGTKHYTEAE